MVIVDILLIMGSGYLAKESLFLTCHYISFYLPMTGHDFLGFIKTYTYFHMYVAIQTL